MRTRALLLILALAGCAAKAPQVTSDEGLAWVAKGSPEAIEAAARALPRANAADAEKLHDALARALQAAPERVLALVGTSDDFAPGHLCVAMPAEGSPPQEVKAELARSRKAIESVTDPKLAKAKEACLAEVAQAETAFDRGTEE